jgi:hypothetical protein
MNKREQIKELIKAQDMIRRVYANQSQCVLNNWLREIDKELTKAINTLGGMIEDLKAN